tara:strand:- start:5947 stop:6243 length:297 start_codon:yes stop_codon:yes gene_type:complete
MNYYVDIDNTICITLNGDYINSKPIKTRIQHINNLFEAGNTIIYWTARGSASGKNYEALTVQQLNKWGCKRHKIIFGKPSYDIFIDDKTIHPEEFFNE